MTFDDDRDKFATPAGSYTLIRQSSNYEPDGLW